jgi:hypothetical protein
MVGYAVQPVVSQHSAGVTDKVVSAFEIKNNLRDFENTEELEMFLAEDDTDTHLFLKADETGVVKLEGNCEDYAIQLQDRALDKGYKMSFYVMDRQEYYQRYGEWLPKGRLHAVNLVIIGNEIYLVEPQTDEYWLRAYLD